MNKKLVIAVGVAVVAAALIIGPSILAGGEKTGAKTGTEADETLLSVKTEKAVKKTLESYIEVNGEIVTEINVDVVPDAGGKLVTLKVVVGSVVSKGSLIAEVDPSKPGIAYSLSPVYAPISGTVTAAPLSVGATVSTSTTIVSVGVMDKLEVEAKIPERDVGQLKAGLKARISLEAFPGEQFAAVVDRVSPIVDSASRSKEVILKFEKKDPRVNVGMYARIKLYTATYPDRVVVQEGALVTQQEATYVYVVNADETVTRHEVKTGVTVDGMVEIIDGIAVDESVVIQGQALLGDGVKVRVVNASGSAS